MNTVPHWVMLLGAAICALAILSVVCKRLDNATCWKIRDYVYFGVRDIGTWRGIVAVLSVGGARVADLDLINMVTLITVALGLLETLWPSKRSE